MSEPDDIAAILRAAGYEIVVDPDFGELELPPISEAIKDAPKHWP